ncbi:hypothetical protein X801_04762 [Opisthorchis viverrini]|uniref:RRM domain-containing protein n=1 Tax=Opisthorchis viverrini TaxID=6198 RepID=A0A1S8WY86_OPIVI|nr:hypothetical protein X801_04762 [Opisthorchis viverrini]
MDSPVASNGYRTHDSPRGRRCRSRGFGFVYFNHLSDAKVAKSEAHGMEVDGRPIRCDFSVTDRPHSPTPGIYMGRPTR